MPTYITYAQHDEDSIRIFMADPLVIGICSREDLPNLAKLDEVKKAGIYILIDGNKRYVGQAVSGIHGRLDSHYKNKDWWTTLIFIAHQYGGISPDKLNHLEAKLIKEFSIRNFDMDNGNAGVTTSYISTPARLEADRFLADAIDGLAKIAHIDIYAKSASRKRSSVAFPEMPTSSNENAFNRNAKSRFENYRFIVRDSLNNEVFSNHSSGSKSLVVSYLQELVKNENYRVRLIEYAKNITEKNIITISDEDPRSGKAEVWHHLIENVWVYKNTNVFEAQINLYKISKVLDLNVVITDNSPHDEAELTDNMRLWKEKLDTQMRPDNQAKEQVFDEAAEKVDAAIEKKHTKKYYGVKLSEMTESNFLFEGETLYMMDQRWPGEGKLVGEKVLVEGEFYSLSPGANVHQQKINPGISNPNGWAMWGVKRNGELVTLDEMRKQYLASKRNEPQTSF